MDSQPTVIAPPSLMGFCQAVRIKYASNWPPTEDTIAREFITYFQTKEMVFGAGVQKLCGSLQITVRVAALPESLHGHNYRFREQREILISEKQQFWGTEEHTTLHELRELLEYEFRDLSAPIFTHDDKEERAEEFAVAVRMLAFTEELPNWLDQASSIERKWPRRAAYLLLAVFGVIYTMGVTLLPHWENIATDRESADSAFQNN